MSNSVFDDPCSPQVTVETPRKERISLDTSLKTGAAVLVFISTMSGWTNGHPFRTNALILASIAVLLWILGTWALKQIRAILRRSEARQFVRREQHSLNDLVRDFERFVDNSRRESFIYILRNMGNSNIQYLHLLNVDYIQRWLYCFNFQGRIMTDDLSLFIARCQELTVMVQQFNLDYVLRARQEFQRGAPLQEQHIHDLEAFREDFSAHLRNLSSWGDRISTEARRLGGNKAKGVSLVTYFERVKTFRIANPQQ